MSGPSDVYISHILRTTLDSLNLLTSQHILQHSAEIDRVKSQLQEQLATSSFSGLSVSHTPPNNNPYSSHTPSLAPSNQSIPNLPPRNPTPSSQAPPYTVPPPPPQPIPSEKQQDRARALWDYHGSEPDDLTLRKDEMVIITEEVNGQWFRGYSENDPTRRQGLFPHSYVQRIPVGFDGDNKSMQPYGTNPPYSTNSSGHYGAAPYPQPPYQSQPQPYPQQMVPGPQPPQQVVVQQPQPPEKKHKFPKIGKGSGMGNTLAHSAVGGLGFGAGSAIAGNIVNAIL